MGMGMSTLVLKYSFWKTVFIQHIIIQVLTLL